MSKQAPAPTTGQDQRVPPANNDAQPDAGIFTADDFYADAPDAGTPAPANGKTGGGKPPARQAAKPAAGDLPADGDEAAGGEGEDGDLPADGEEAAGGEGDGEEGTPAAIAQVNEWLGEVAQDPAKAALLKVPVKIDGVAAAVPLSDLVKSYQIGEAASNRLEEAKQIKLRAQQEVQTQIEALTGEFAVAATLIGNFEQQLAAEEKAVDWPKLRAEDPAEYSAKRTEFAERRQAFERMKTEARDAYQRSVQTNQGQLTDELRETIRTEQTKLREAVPAFADPKTGKEERVKHTRYLLDQGFTKEDIQGAVDHRLHVMAHKARLYDESQEKIDTATKRVRQAPKVLKPGGKPAPKPKPKSDAEIMYG